MKIDERHDILNTHVSFWYAVRVGTTTALLSPQAAPGDLLLIKPKSGYDYIWAQATVELRKDVTQGHESLSVWAFRELEEGEVLEMIKIKILDQRMSPFCETVRAAVIAFMWKMEEEVRQELEDEDSSEGEDSSDDE